MTESSENVVTKLVDRVFPRMPDFYGLMNDQCDHLVTRDGGVCRLHAHRQDPKTGKRSGEHPGKGRRRVEAAQTFTILNKAFATPMDREEIYRAIDGIDHVLNYAKTTVREIELRLMIRTGQLHPGDGHAIMKDWRRGTTGRLSEDQRLRRAEAEAEAQAARKAERQVEKCYRRALAELFTAEAYHAELQEQGGGTGSDALRCMTEIMKRREVLPPPVERRRSPGACGTDATRHHREDRLSQGIRPS